MKTIAADFLDADHYQGSVYRMDGVRFAFYFENKNKEWITEFYDELKQNIKKQQILKEKPIAITFSAGAVILDDNAGIHSVLTGLSYAFSLSKHDRHGELVFFDTDTMDHGRRNLELLETLRHSVLNGCRGFYLNY